MRRIALIACAVLISSGAEAQAPSTDRTCSVDVIDTARYGAGSLYRDCDVDRPAKLKRSTRPVFNSTEGVRCAIVELEFAVDEEGRAIEATAVILSANVPEFGERTLRSLADWRYEPARKGGVAVRQVVRERVARKNERAAFVVTQPGERRPAATPEPPCK